MGLVKPGPLRESRIRFKPRKRGWKPLIKPFSRRARRLLILTYDMAGRMLTRTSGGVTTTFLWDGWDCIRESTPTSTTHYLIPEGQLLGFRRDGEQYSVASDALGCVRLVTDSSGEVVFRRDYGAFGETLPGGFDNVPGGMPYGFVGALGVRTDADNGLLYMRQRWYDSTLQRFISRDQLHSRNRYDYAAGSPVNLVDIDGLEPMPPIQIPRPQSQRVTFPNGAASGRPGRGRDGSQPRITNLPSNQTPKGAAPTSEGEWQFRADHPELWNVYLEQQGRQMEFPKTNAAKILPYRLPSIEILTDTDKSVVRDPARVLWRIVDECTGNQCLRKRETCHVQARNIYDGNLKLLMKMREACQYWYYQCLLGYGPFPSWNDPGV